MTGVVAPRSAILRARWVIPVAGRVLDGGWLRIERGRVRALGSGPPPGPAIDLGEVVVVPGLVNAHTHLEFSLLPRPLPGDGGLPAWIARLVALRRAEGSDPAARGRAIAAGLAESLAAGVTAIGEIATAPMPEGLPAARPRLRVYRECLGLAPAAAGRAAALEREGFAVGARCHSGISPHAPYSVAAPLGRRLVAIARRRRLPVAMHLAEAEEEAGFLETGTGPFRELLDGLGAWPAPPPDLLPVADWLTLLARAPRGLVIHATFVAAGSAPLDRLARHRDRLAVAVCPRTARLLSGRDPPLAALRAAGVRVALGTDGRGSSPDLDPRGECRTLVDAGLATPAEALAMATTDAAWGIGLEHVSGRLAPGRPADLAVIATGRTADPHAALLDPAAPVAATFLAGRVVHGRLPA